MSSSVLRSLNAENRILIVHAIIRHFILFINKTYTVHCHMVALCTVTVLICNISIGSTASLCSLSMELREAELFYGKKILIKFVFKNMFFFLNYFQQVKSRFTLNMDLNKSGIVFLFRTFLLCSCYPYGKVPGLVHCRSVVM